MPIIIVSLRTDAVHTAHFSIGSGTRMSTRPLDFAFDHIPRPDRDRALQDFVKARLQPYKYPRLIDYVTELP